MNTLSAPSIYQSPKCYVTHGTMAHPDPKQPPSKGKPWNVFLGLDFVHQVDLILPREAMEKMRAALIRDDYVPSHYRVVMRLCDILEGEFLTQFIKIRDIMMLSEGRMGQDHVFTIRHGKLTMYLDKEAYERAGLVGKPHSVKGKRGTKPRWIVSFDLKASSSFPGKRGYDKLLYACQNVFTQPLTWLFQCQSDIPKPNPLIKYMPVKYTSSPCVIEDIRVRMPEIKPPDTTPDHAGKMALEEYATELYEWLSLIRLQSLRIASADKIDPYLSRYGVPGDAEIDAETLGEADLYKISWRGFISPIWVRHVLMETKLALSSRSWFSISVATFGHGLKNENSEITMLRPPESEREYVLWDIHGAA